ncbi:MAG TPA: Rieske 2Fe-2S domain-containing protein [Acidimicrobiales bacterium]|nr:Rieske 2Fe-2S domain-containing protein [Acidimicrobiales bacterium]
MRATSLGHAGILIETAHGSILCDPWFVPAFFGSWFVFPRNDQLPDDLRVRIERPDYLYISHLHGDHLDAAFLAEHVDRHTTVLLPGFPTGELQRRLRSLGFRRFVVTGDGEPVSLGGLVVAIHVETSITDGPGGDSALVVSDGECRLMNQNDCRLNDLSAVTRHGPVDMQWLQYSGAIWYPMVYDEPEEVKRELATAKVESQFGRALRYVEAVGARVVVPSAGPPCFLDPDLFGLNVVAGDEISIFPDATAFLERLRKDGIDTGVLAIPGTTIDVTSDTITVDQPVPDDDLGAIFADKGAYLRRYQRDWTPWLDQLKSTWPAPQPDLADRLAAWWEPLLDAAPTLSAAIDAPCLIRSGDEDVIVDFRAGTVRSHAGEPYAFSFDLPRPLVEQVVAERAVDWSNSLFLSLRFRAWRAGEFNEYLYNFFKSLSPERMARANAEAAARRAPEHEPAEEIELGGYVMERYCPHRRADLSIFGEVDDGVLTCALHGWQFDLETGECLTSDDRHLRVRRAEPAS